MSNSSLTVKLPRLFNLLYENDQTIEEFSEALYGILGEEFEIEEVGLVYLDPPEDHQLNNDFTSVPEYRLYCIFCDELPSRSELGALIQQQNYGDYYVDLY